MNGTNDRQYLTCAESAKMLREALKHDFPAVKFSVRSSVYSGGASITVNYNDGPRQSDVQAVCDRFAGASFDGMDDSTSYHDSTLSDGRVVHFGSNYVFANRHVSPAVNAETIALLKQRMSDTVPDYEWERRAWQGVQKIAILADESPIVSACAAVEAFFGGAAPPRRRSRPQFRRGART